MQPIRILQIVPNMHAAGLETLIMNLYRNIDRTKIQFDFLVHYTEKCFYDDEIESMGGHIYRLSFREDGNIIKYLKDLNAFFKTHKYQIVHGHMASTAFFYLKYAKKYGVPIRILHSHNTSTERTFKGFVKHQLLKLSTIYANYYFACGKLAGEYLYGNKKFEIVHNAIDLNKFKKDNSIRCKMRNEYNISNDFIIGHIGRFNTQKNHRFLINMFEQFHKENTSSKLILVGEGELEKEIKHLVEEKGLSDSVMFLGVIKDTNAIYNMIDVFALPSLFEGLPVVGVESQATECITLMSDKITDEVKLTNYVEFLPIDGKDSIDQWCRKLKEYSICNINDKKDEAYQKLTDGGFNILNEALELTRKYEEMLKEKGDK